MRSCHPQRIDYRDLNPLISLKLLFITFCTLLWI